ncbi:MAG TPA: osmotically inducible protein C [Bacteroidales bacterium]|nr:osmotically inducible protein C [Bacteroidales bacterium]HBZ21485.1 osmotically inducible protein C [Bacteroidales bacterium]
MIEITFDGGKVVTAHSHGHMIRTDQPSDNGGGDTAPAPFELFLASIGTCAGIYVKSFCDNRQIPAENIKLIQTTVYNKETGLPVSIKLDIKLPPDFPEKYKASLLHVAGLCKVKKSIANPPEFEIITSSK